MCVRGIKIASFFYFQLYYYWQRHALSPWNPGEKYRAVLDPELYSYAYDGKPNTPENDNAESFLRFFGQSFYEFLKRSRVPFWEIAVWSKGDLDKEYGDNYELKSFKKHAELESSSAKAIAKKMILHVVESLNRVSKVSSFKKHPDRKYIELMFEVSTTLEEELRAIDPEEKDISFETQFAQFCKLSYCIELIISLWKFTELNIKNRKRNNE